MRIISTKSLFSFTGISSGSSRMHYAHDEADGFAAGERYLPDGMTETVFYRPVERGLEIKIADKLRELNKSNHK